MGQNPVDSPLYDLMVLVVVDEAHARKDPRSSDSDRENTWKLALGLVLFSEQCSFLESPGFLLLSLLSCSPSPGLDDGRVG